MSTVPKSDLEDINPAFSAKVVLLSYRIIFAFLFLIFSIAPIVGMAIEHPPVGALIGIIIAVPSTLILVLIYNHVTRVSIASLMTWHFARETALTNREILACLRAGTTPSAPHVTTEVQPTPPNPNAPLSTPKARVQKIRVSKPTPAPASPVEAGHIVTVCPACGARFRAKSSFIGKSIPCPKCGESFNVQEA